MSSPEPVVVIGAGPAGLTAAYELGKAGVPPVVLEATDVVGGISRTVERDGWRFDIGGHRFFTKVPEVEALWHEILPADEFLLRPRMSRIYYRGKLFDYPLKAINALRQPRPPRGAQVRAVLRLGARSARPRTRRNFEGWVAARFGWRLYRIFFKTYTEKVWGVPATEIQADWAAQRIKNLSLFNAVAQRAAAQAQPEGDHLAHRGVPVPQVRPRHDVGARREHVEGQGGTVLMESKVTRIDATTRTARRTVVARTPDGEMRLSARHVVSSMPISSLVRVDGPAGARRGARGRRRPALPRLPHRRAGRARRASASRTTGSTSTARGAGRPDPELRLLVAVPGQGRPHLPRPGVLRQRGRRPLGQPGRGARRARQKELDALGLVTGDVFEAGYVVRMPKAYPVYDEFYKANVDVIRALAGRGRAQRAPGRPQRHAPLQQPRPQHDDGAAHREEHPRRQPAARRLGRSTSRRTTTRSRPRPRPAGTPVGTGRDAPIIPRRAA